MNALIMWTVYDKPRDFPDKFVARKWEIRPGIKNPIPTSDIIVSQTLDGVRAALPQGLFRQPSMPCDETHIVEVWF